MLSNRASEVIWDAWIGVGGHRLDLRMSVKDEPATENSHIPQDIFDGYIDAFRNALLEMAPNLHIIGVDKMDHFLIVRTLRNGEERRIKIKNLGEEQKTVFWI